MSIENLRCLIFLGSTSSFANGGNLEELLQDIHTISSDILQISGDISNAQKSDPNETNKPYKTELNVVLMPKPMPLLGFEKYDELKSSLENFQKSSDNLQKLDLKIPEGVSNMNENFCLTPYSNNLPYSPTSTIETPDGPRRSPNPFKYLDNFQNSDKYNDSYDNYGFKSDCVEKSNRLNEIDENNEININNENEEKDQNPAKVNAADNDKNEDKKDSNKSPKMGRTRKVSIYFKGKKDKLARSLSLDIKPSSKKNDQSKITSSPTTPKKETTIQETESKNSIFEPNTSKADDKIINSDAKNSTDSKNSYDRRHRKSSSTSPERKHHKHDEGKKGHKKHRRKPERRMTLRRNSVSLDRQRGRSTSICTDTSHILDHRFGHFDDFTNSDRERTNSLSSCDSIKSRKNSIPAFQSGGKIPWFGCWGNGCI